MEAFISGSAGVAAISHGSYVELYQHGVEECVRLSQMESDRIFQSCDDLVVVADYSKRDVLRRLKTESDRSESLLLLLTILNPEISWDSKVDLSDCLNYSMSKTDDLVAYLNNVLFSRPLPGDSVCSIPENILDRAPLVGTMLSRLLEVQPDVCYYYETFVKTCNANDIGQRDRDLLEGFLVNASVPYGIISRTFDSKALSAVKFDLLLHLSNSNVNNRRRFVANFLGCFDDYISLEQKTAAVDSLRIATPTGTEKASTASSGKLTPHQSYTNATAQLERIHELLDDGDANQAERFADQLIRDQVERGDSAFAAQSLCQLSGFAKKNEFFDLQLYWARRAIEVEPSDARAYAHVADAYLQKEDIESARNFFEQSVSAGSEFRLYGLIGLSRIERSLYNFEAGLDYIERALSDYPESEMALALKAELLRDSGRLDEAVSAYEICIEKHPNLPTPMCGLAATYSDQRKFDLAENTYRLVIESLIGVEGRSVALCGLGYLYAKQGRFLEGHSLIDESIGLSRRDDIVPRISKAKCYKLEGDFDAAESYYQNLIEKSGQHISYSEGLIELYIDFDRVQLAEESIISARNKFGDNENIQFLEAILKKKKSAYAEALAILDRIKARKPRMIKPLLERASIFKMSGDFQESRKQYLEILDINIRETKAHTGLSILDALENSVAAKKLGSSFYEENKPITSEDYVQMGVTGIILLSQGNIRDAKKLLLMSYNCEFGLVRSKFAAALSLARVMQNQYGSALKSVKHPESSIDHIQRALIFGERNETRFVKESLAQASKCLPPFSRNIVRMAEKRYLVGTYVPLKNIPSANDIFQEQVQALLIAA